MSASDLLALTAANGEVLPPESCDDEIAGMMARLDKLQHWLVMQSCQRQGDRHFMSAATLVQDVRVLLVERCFNQPDRAQTKEPQ